MWFCFPLPDPDPEVLAAHPRLSISFPQGMTISGGLHGWYYWLQFKTNAVWFLLVFLTTGEPVQVKFAGSTTCVSRWLGKEWSVWAAVRLKSSALLFLLTLFVAAAFPDVVAARVGYALSLIHISEPTDVEESRMPSSA